MDNKKIGLFIKELRENNNLTQQQLADNLYIDRTVINKWEHGTIVITSPNLLILSKYFGVSTDELLTGEKRTKDNKEKIDNIKLEIYDEKVKLSKKVKIFFEILMLTLMLFLIYFFFNFYNSINVYTITVQSDNIEILNGILIKTREKIYFQIDNEFKIEDNTIKCISLNYEIDGVKKQILQTTDINSISFTDFIGYEEYLEFNKISKIINNMYIEIQFENGDKDNVKLFFYKDYANTNLFIKNDKIISNKNSKDMNVEKSKKYNDFLEIFEILKNRDNYIKITYKNKNYIAYITDETLTVEFYENNNKIEFIYLVFNHEFFEYNYYNENGKLENVYRFDLTDDNCVNGKCETYKKDVFLYQSIINQIKEKAK